MMTTNLFVIANVKQMRTDGSFRILLHFFRTFWGVSVQNSAIFKFSQSGLVWYDFGGPLEFRYATATGSRKCQPRFVKLTGLLKCNLTLLRGLL